MSHLSYAGASEYLNRLSWKREDSQFLNNMLIRPNTRFLILCDLNPLVHRQEKDTSTFQFLLLNYKDVQHFISADHFKAESHYQQLAHPAHPQHLHSHDNEAPLVLFLGVDESSKSENILPENPSSYDEYLNDAPAYFSIDLTPLSDISKKLLADLENNDSEKQFLNIRASADLLPPQQLATAGLARALTDWHRRNRFCAGCGRPTVIVSGGWKRFCCPDDTERGTCISRKGVHNFSFPRTDTVVIVAIKHPTKDKILLGRQKSWPQHFYSTLAGFIEPGESLSEAVQREVLEEAGVHVSEVKFHASQPWPYPGSLMMGCIAQASSEEIRTDLDNELEDARWFSRARVLSALGSKPGLSSQEVKHMHDNYGSTNSQLSKEEIDKLRASEEENIILRLPPPTAIANVLISSWAKDRI